MSNDPAPGSPGLPLLSISVISHGDGQKLPALLESLARHERGERLQMIVTDNLRDNLPPMDPGPWHSLTLLRNRSPRGFAANHNAAFRLAGGEYFCVLNPDICFIEPILERLIGRIRGGEAGIAAPLVIDAHGVMQDSFRSLPTPAELFRRRVMRQTPAAQLPGGDPFSPDWIAGFFLLMSRSLYARLGGMDERYRLYMEDVDFCTRARLSGAKLLIDPGIHLQHDAQRASRQDLRHLLWHTSSALRFFMSPVYRRARKAR